MREGPRLHLCVLCLALLLWGRARPTGAAPEPSLAVQVNEAIDRGVDFLRGMQASDGSYAGSHGKAYDLGNTGLVVLSLIRAGVGPDEPDIASAVTHLTSQRAKTTYDAALVILALDATADPAVFPHLRRTAEWLLGAVDEKTGLWAYPAGPVDLSNTQLALLAMHAAGRRGVEVPRSVWKRACGSLRAFRHRKGGYTYRAPPGGQWQTGSMTTAALTVFHLAERGLKAAGLSRSTVRAIEKRRADAWAWMDAHFAVAGNPIGGHYLAEKDHLYYLYGLERVAALASRTSIGGRDWYREGARLLVAEQRDDGSWQDVTSTCFALLFLRRATFTSLGEQPDALADDEVGSRSSERVIPSWPYAPVIERWLTLGPFSNPGDADGPAVLPGESELEPVAGRRVAGKTWTRESVTGRRIAVARAAHQLAYLGTWLHVSRAVDVVLWIEQRQGLVVYVGGKAVHERRIVADEVRWTPVPLRLEAGVHALLLRGETWGERGSVGIGITNPAGHDVSEVRWSCERDRPDTAWDLAMRPFVVPLEEMRASLPVDVDPHLGFNVPEDLERVVLRVAAHGRLSFHSTRPMRPEGSDAGRSGVLCARPPAGARAVVLYRRIPTPPAGSTLTATVALVGPRMRDLTRRVEATLRVFDGATRDVVSAPVSNAAAGSRDPWTTVVGEMPDTEADGILLGLVVEARRGVFTEADRIYVDEIRVE